MYFLTGIYYIMFFWLLLVRESLIMEISFLFTFGQEGGIRIRAAAISYKDILNGQNI